MKSNIILKLSFYIIIFCHFLSANSNELKFEATSIELIDKDKIIIAKKEFSSRLIVGTGKFPNYEINRNTNRKKIWYEIYSGICKFNLLIFD